MSCHEEQALLWVQKSCFSPRYPKHCSVELINVVQKRCKPGCDSRRWQLYLNFDLCSSHRAKTETPDRNQECSQYSCRCVVFRQHTLAQ